MKKIINKIIVSIILPLIERMLNQKSQDIKLARQIKALFETAEYIVGYKHSINSVNKPIEIHDIALSYRKLDGLFLKFSPIY